MNTIDLKTSFINELASILDEHHISWALQGNYESIDRWRNSGPEKDLDIWVSSASSTKLDAVMKNFNSYKIIHTKNPMWLKHTIYIVRFTEVDIDIQVDFTVGNLMVGPFILCQEKLISTCRHEDNLIWLDGLSLISDLLLRPALRGKDINHNNFIIAKEIWHKYSSDLKEQWCSNLSSQIGKGNSIKFCRSLEQSCNVSKLSYFSLYMKLITKLCHNPELITLYSKKLTNMLQPLYQMMFGRRTKPITFVLLGTDGTGKTTLSDALCCEFTRLNINIDYIYMGRGKGNFPGINGLRNILSTLLGLNSFPSPKDNSANNSTSNTTLQLLIYKIGTWYYLLEYSFRCTSFMLKKYLSGHFLILDRYIYDLFIMPHSSKIASKIAINLLHRPDVVIFLNPDPETIYKRKIERSPDMIYKHQETYQTLVKLYPGKQLTLVLDTTKPIDSCVNEIMNNVYPLLFRNYNY